MPDSARTMSDRTADVLGVTRNPLESFFAPASVAVIGATEKVGSVGRTVFWNLISSPFGGTVYPVNKGRPSILGVRAYPNLAALPEVPELVVIVTPAATIPATVEECAAAGVKSIVIISAGSRRSARRAPSWSARSWPRHGRTGSGSSGRTAWA